MFEIKHFEHALFLLLRLVLVIVLLLEPLILIFLN